MLDNTYFFISNILIIIGWFVIAFLKDRNDITEKRRSVRIEHLINAYTVLCSWVHNTELTNEQKSEIEKVIYHIQLLGSKRVLDVLNIFLKSWEKDMGGDIAEMLVFLKSELRSELKLDKVDYSKTIFFRFNRKIDQI